MEVKFLTFSAGWHYYLVISIIIKLHPDFSERIAASMPHSFTHDTCIYTEVVKTYRPQKRDLLLITAWKKKINHIAPL